MEVITREITVSTKGENDIINITDDVSNVVRESKLSNGHVLIFAVGSTGAVTTIEYEPGLTQDFPDALSRIAPENMEYEHHKRWHDDNGRSHVKASLVGPSLTVPFIEGSLILGTWQQVVFVELDTRNRKRRIIIQITGK